jgi:hypothetical protein
MVLDLRQLSFAFFDLKSLFAENFLENRINGINQVGSISEDQVASESMMAI